MLVSGRDLHGVFEQANYRIKENHSKARLSGEVPTVLFQGTSNTSKVRRDVATTLRLEGWTCSKLGERHLL